MTYPRKPYPFTVVNNKEKEVDIPDFLKEPPQVFTITEQEFRRTQCNIATRGYQHGWWQGFKVGIITMIVLALAIGYVAWRINSLPSPDMLEEIPQVYMAS